MEMYFYLAEVFDTFSNLFIVLGSIALIFSIILVLVQLDDCDEEQHKRLIKNFKKTLIISLIVLLIGILLPSKKTMYLMKGFSVIEESQKDTTSITHKTILLLNKYLDEEIDKK